MPSPSNPGLTRAQTCSPLRLGEAWRGPGGAAAQQCLGGGHVTVTSRWGPAWTTLLKRTAHRDARGDSLTAKGSRGRGARWGPGRPRCCVLAGGRQWMEGQRPQGSSQQKTAVAGIHLEPSDLPVL